MYRTITKEAVVPAGISDVWKAWTTKEGIQSFFAPECNIEYKLFGRYEMIFLPDAKRGSQGGEGNIILAIEFEKMLSFCWNAPPQIPEVRNQRTFVTLKFEKAGENETQVHFCQAGWGDSEEWDKAYDYFDKAWDRVFTSLITRFKKGSVNWEET